MAKPPVDWAWTYRGRTALQRFLAKVDYRSENGCWNWTASTYKGYGNFQTLGQVHGSHRLMFELWYGPIPTGLQIDHICRNRACVNPEHLEPVTQKVNVLRGDAPSAHHAVATHCAHGHPYSGDNLYIAPDGSRSCRVCVRENQRNYHQRLRDKRKAMN